MPNPASLRRNRSDDRFERRQLRLMAWWMLGAGPLCLALWAPPRPAAFLPLITATSLPAFVAFVALAALSGRIAAGIRNVLGARRAAADLGRFMREDAGFRAARAAIHRPATRA